MLKRRLNKAGYEATLGSIKTPVVVGGIDISKDEFVPSVNCSFHPTAAHPRGEAFLDINHIDSLKTARVDSERDGEITHETNGFRHVMKVNEGGKLKWDMIFNAMPPPLRFRIRHSRNLDFHKQQLSAQDILDGSEYAYPEVEGSYAVYFNNGRRNNKYQTGKVCHIDSPFFIDANGKRSPLCGMTLIEVEPGVKRLVLDLPTKWLENAVYPVRLDPTLGYDTKGSLSGAIGSIYFQAPVVQVGAVDGSITKFGSYVPYVVSGKWSAGAYNCPQATPWDSEGYSFVSGVNLTATTAGDKNEAVPDSGTGLISANTYYRIGIVLETGFNIFYDSAPFYDFHEVSGALMKPLPAVMPVTGFGGAGSLISLWIEYDEVVSAVKGFPKGRIVNQGSGSLPQHKGGIVNA